MKPVHDGLTRWQRYRLKYPERRKATDAKSYQKNKAVKIAQAKAWAEKNRSKKVTATAKYFRTHPEARKRKSANRSRREIRGLHDHYLRNLLTVRQQPINHDTINSLRVRLAANRSRKSFQLLAASSILGNLH